MAKNGPKNDNSSHFAKHKLFKKPLCYNPPLDQKLVLFELAFLKRKTLMLNKKPNLKAGKNKDKKRGSERRKKRAKPEKEKGLMNKNFVIECFDVLLCMKQKQT